VTKPSASAFKSLFRIQEWDGLLNGLTKGNMRIAVTNAIPDFGKHGRIPLGICETTRQARWIQTEACKCMAERADGTFDEMRAFGK
jgi:hypothetical protein